MSAVEQKKEAQVRAAALWEDFFQGPSTEKKNNLVVHYIELVRIMVLRIMPTYHKRVEFDDLMSCGVLGLMDAIDRFDMSRGIQFETYAKKRIYGEMLDYMRAQDFISSSMRSRINKLKDATQKLQADHQREPTQEEIAGYMGLNVSQVEKIAQDDYLCSIVNFESLLAGYGEESVQIQDDTAQGNPEEHMLQKEMSRLLASAIEDMPENESKVLKLYYEEELLLREIAQILGVSESRISQIHKKALVRLREVLSGQQAL